MISLEGWTDIMYYVQDAHSFWDWVYFVLLIVVSHILFFFFFSLLFLLLQRRLDTLIAKREAKKKKEKMIMITYFVVSIRLKRLQTGERETASSRYEPLSPSSVKETIK